MQVSRNEIPRFLGLALIFFSKQTNRDRKLRYSARFTRLEKHALVLGGFLFFQGSLFDLGLAQQRTPNGVL
jgi:hypothetical protein